MLEKIANSKSKIFLVVCLAFIFGIALESFLQIRIIWWVPLSLAFVGLFFLNIFWKKKKTRLILLAVVFFVLGFWRFEASLPEFDQAKIQHYYGEQVTWQGVVIAEPEKKQDKIRYTVQAKQIVAPEARVISGKALVSAGLFPEFEYGDLIEVSCKIVKPEPIEDFKYDLYLAKDGIFALCYPYNAIGLVEEDKGNFALAAIYRVKDRFAEVTNQIFPEPQASFLAGLLYGARSGLPQDVLDNFQATGVTHIIAISGYNITIVSAVFLIIAYSLGLRRKKAFPIVVLAIVIFVIFTGASPSVVRAGIMGILVLFAKQVGRTSRIFNVLIFTAAFMSLQNPWVLVFDAGFQLSFLATVGLVYLSPLIGPWFERVPKFLGFQESLCSTLSAIALTTPLILFQFGRFSLIAPLANILILSAIPLTMALGFGAALLGFAWIALGQVFSWLPWIILTYMLKVTEIFSTFKIAQLEVPNFHWIFLGLMYLVLGLFIYFGNKRLRQRADRL